MIKTAGGFSFNQLLNALLPLKQEIDCRAILSKKFCSTINFSNWRTLIKTSTNSKQEKIKNPRHIKTISVKNPKQFFSEKIIFFNANLCCCENWKHVVFTLLINLNKSNFGPFFKLKTHLGHFLFKTPSARSFELILSLYSAVT